MTLPSTRSRLATFFASPAGRLLGLSALILILLMPLGMINEQVKERGQRRDVAAADIAASWGGQQTVAGPLLRLPYTHRWLEKHDDGVIERVRHGWLSLSPQKLSVTGQLDAEVRKRGIFEVPVYGADMQLRGHFQMPEKSSLPIDAQSLEFGKAELLLGVSSPGAIGAQSRVVVGTQTLELEPSARDLGSQGVHAVFHQGIPRAELEAGLHFEIDLQLQGSGRFALAPVARQTTLALSSNWAHPGFQGASLPTRREVADQGFSASWSVSSLGSGYPPLWLDQDVTRAQLDFAAFGVALIVPVDPYTMAARVAKYAALLLLLSFAVIWVMELLGGSPMHPIQYLLLGGSLCLFGLLQLALAEHLGFALAFALAAAAVIAQASWYARIATGSRSRAAVLGGLLTAWFAYLYVILQAEDLAFLLGALALFAGLTGVMWATRKVNWASGKKWDVADAVLES